MSLPLTPVMYLLSFYVMVAVFGLVGFRLLTAPGLRPNEAWLGGRMAGMLAVIYPAGWTGVLGITQWQAVGTAILIPGSLSGLWLLLRQRREWRAVAVAELTFFVSSTLVLLMRLTTGTDSGHRETDGSRNPDDALANHLISST
ncbi:MAG: hypothetical protein AB7G75_31725 [Candidatus Binatia bacterium]